MRIDVVLMEGLLFEAVFVLFLKVEPLNLFPCLYEVGGTEAYAIADVKGRGGVSGDYFYQYAPISLVIEENIVALTLAAKVVHEVVHADLDEVCQGAFLFLNER